MSVRNSLQPSHGASVRRQLTACGATPFLGGGARSAPLLKPATERHSRLRPSSSLHWRVRYLSLYQYLILSQISNWGPLKYLGIRPRRPVLELALGEQIAPSGEPMRLLLELEETVPPVVVLVVVMEVRRIQSMGVWSNLFVGQYCQVLA